MEIPANRVSVAMAPGDQALVLRLRERLPEGKVLSEGERSAAAFGVGVVAARAPLLPVS